MKLLMPSSMAIRHVLLIDDNDGDVKLVRAAAEDFINLAITHLPNASLANRYLFRNSPFEECAKPDLVLLDLRMPAIDGSVVLQFMRESPEHAQTPVVVFTTSQRDEARCRQLGANDYVIKPADWKVWQTTIRGVFRRYLHDL